MQEGPYLHNPGPMLARFKHIPLLQKLPEQVLKQVLQMSKLRRYESGETILQEDAYDRWMYILIQGEAEVYKDGETLVTLTQPGEVFGELAVIDGEARCATVQAASECVCLAMDITSLEVEGHLQKEALRAAFYQMFAQILGERLRATDAELARTKEALALCQQTNKQSATG